MTRKRGRKKDSESSRARKTRTGVVETPDDVNSYEIDLCRGVVPSSSKMVDHLSGIPANLDDVNRETNHQRRQLDTFVEEFQAKRKHKHLKPETEIQGTLAGKGKREKFFEIFQELHAKKGYAPSSQTLTSDLNPLFYDNPSDYGLPSEPTLQNVNPLTCLKEKQIETLTDLAYYQEIEMLVGPFRDEEKEFYLTTERREMFDQAGWLICHEAIQPDARFVSELFVSRDGMWGLYVMQKPTEDAPDGLPLAYYLYVARQGKSND